MAGRGGHGPFCSAPVCVCVYVCVHVYMRVCECARALYTVLKRGSSSAGPHRNPCASSCLSVPWSAFARALPLCSSAAAAAAAAATICTTSCGSSGALWVWQAPHMKTPLHSTTSTKAACTAAVPTLLCLLVPTTPPMPPHPAPVTPAHATSPRSSGSREHTCAPCPCLLLHRRPSPSSCCARRQS